MAGLVACNSSKGIYISEYVQTDSRETKYDLKFKAEKIEEMERISVADSIAIIMEKFDSEKNSRIESPEKTITINREMIEKQKAARYPSQTMINAYQSGMTNKRLFK